MLYGRKIEMAFSKVSPQLKYLYVAIIGNFRNKCQKEKIFFFHNTYKYKTSNFHFNYALPHFTSL